MKQKETSHRERFSFKHGRNETKANFTPRIFPFKHMRKEKETSHSGRFPLKHRRKETKGNRIQWNTSIQSQSADREPKNTFPIKASRNKTRSRLRVVIRRHPLLSSPPARSVGMGGVYSDIPGDNFVSEFLSPRAACPLCVDSLLLTKISARFIALDQLLLSDPSQ